MCTTGIRCPRCQHQRSGDVKILTVFFANLYTAFCLMLPRITPGSTMVDWFHSPLPLPSDQQNRQFQGPQTMTIYKERTLTNHRGDNKQTRYPVCFGCLDDTQTCLSGLIRLRTSHLQLPGTYPAYGERISLSHLLLQLI